MTAGTNVVKITAKAALKENWLKAIFACSVYVFSHFICIYSASLLGFALDETLQYALVFLAAIFLLCPLGLGLIRFFWRLIMGADDSPIIVLYYFENKKLYLKAMRLIVSLIVRIIGISLLVLLPAIAVWIISNPNIYEFFDMAIPIWSSNLNTVWSILSAISVFIIISFSIKYYLAPLLIVADENMDVYEAIHMSKVITKKTHLDFVFMIFGFIGWILLSVLVIPLTFTMPYMITAYAVHCRFAIADYNIYINKSNSTDFGYFGNYGNEI